MHLTRFWPNELLISGLRDQLYFHIYSIAIAANALDEHKAMSEKTLVCHLPLHIHCYCVVHFLPLHMVDSETSLLDFSFSIAQFWDWPEETIIAVQVYRQGFNDKNKSQAKEKNRVTGKSYPQVGQGLHTLSPSQGNLPTMIVIHADMW